MLEEHEPVEADKGCIGECPQHCVCPGHITSNPTTGELQTIVRSRTETINSRFKQWGELKQCFRTLDIAKHGKGFRVVAMQTQLAIENGERLFDLEHIDPHINDLTL